MTTSRNVLIAVSAALALAAPTMATAAPGKGKSGEARAKAEAKADARGKSGEARGKGKGKAKGHAKAKHAVFKGTVVSVDGSTVVVHVDKANRWGRDFKGEDVAFDVTGAKKADEVAAGDSVLVQARLSKDDEPPFAARKLKQLDADEAPETEGTGTEETEASETEETTEA